MKTITKTIFTITLFFTFIITSSAKTNYIGLASTNNNTPIYLKVGDTETYTTMKTIRNYEKNDLLYSITPNIEFERGYFEVYNYYWQLNLNEEDYKNISAFIYFGYGYKNRTDLKWYDITQYLIWDYVLGDSGEISFIDDNNNQINPYESEIAEIKEDIKNMYVLPSFLEEYQNKTVANLKINEKITLKDQNGVLNNISISNPYNSNLTVDYQNNEVTVSFTEPGTNSLTFTKELLANKEMHIYKKGENILLSRGTFNFYSNSIFFDILYPSLKISLKDNENNQIIEKDIEVAIYNSLDELQGIYKTNEEGEIYLDQIYKDNYYLRELTSPYGYESSKDNIYFKIASDDVELAIINKPIMKEVTIEKLLVNKDKITISPNSTFEIINKKTNETTKIVKTNNQGLATFNLPYGSYLIKEINPSIEYITPDISLEINENYLENKLTIKSTRLMGNLKVQVLDSTNNLVKDNVTFKIKNLNTNTYLNNGKSYTTINSELLINNLEHGHYLLEEITASSNYLPLKTYINFNITKESEIVKLNILEDIKEEGEQTEKIETIETEDRFLIEVPSTGNKENLLTVLICTFILCLGIYICNYEE